MAPAVPRVHPRATGGSTGPARPRRPARSEPATTAYQAEPAAAVAEQATLLIRGLAARTYIGITADERAKRQDVLIDLSLEVSTRAGRTDRIDDAVDYKAVKDTVLEYVEGTEHRLLEALAQGIADQCLRQPGVEAVGVEVDKPGALRFARSVAVRIHRDRTQDGPHDPGAAPPRRPSGGTPTRNWGHRG